MTIKAWKHPVKYLRLVTTPTCDLSEATEGNVRLFALGGEPVILINLADVSYAEVVYE